MSLRKKKKTNEELDPEVDGAATDERTFLDKLIDMRMGIAGQSAVTNLIDLLIDENGGDVAALAEEREANSFTDSAAGIEKMRRLEADRTDTTNFATNTNTGTGTDTDPNPNSTNRPV
jgi:hypothetical protein